jgi:hypothetical protein
VLTSLRRVYVLALSVTAIVHIMTIAIMLLALLFPTLSVVGAPSLLRPSAVFIPRSPLSSDKVTSVTQGCLNLLQYDMYFACGASQAWAHSLYRALCRDSSSIGSLLKLAILTLLFGPRGAALRIVWMSDEQVLGQKKTENGDSSKKSI